MEHSSQQQGQHPQQQTDAQLTASLQDDTNSIADSAFSMDHQQGQNANQGPFAFVGNLFRRPRNPPAVQQAMPAFGNMFQSPHPWTTVSQRFRRPEPSVDLLRIAVAKTLAQLKPDKRHLLLDLLATEPSFACLFAYVQGAGAAASAQAAQRTEATPEHLAKLAAHKAAVEAAPMPAEPAAGAGGPGPMEVDGGVSAPVLAVSCVPEFDSYGSSTADGRVRVVVSLKATSEVKKQGHVALTSVLDVSGSMSGRRIELVKETSHFLIQQVTRGDFLGFISYSSDANVDVPLVRMTPNAKRFAQTVVESLDADGSTALFDGTVCGMQQQLEGLTDDSRLAKAVLLCTDGEATDGPRSSDEILPRLQEQCRAAGQPCTIHTFGIGSGHCAELLQAIAEARTGSYYYIRDTNDVAPAYGDALGGLLSVVAKNVRVTVRAGAAGAPTALHAGGVVQGRTVIYNDLYAEESRELLLAFALPPAPTSDGPSTSAAATAATATGDGSTHILGEVQVEYIDPAADGAAACVVVPITITRGALGAATAPSPLVLTTAARYEAADVIEKAQQLNQEGKLQDATKMLSRYAQQLDSISVQAPQEVAKQLGVFSSQAKMVARTMEEAERSKQDAGFSHVMSKAATVGLRQQRAANVGATSALPQTAMYDNKSKAAVRKSAFTSVTASMAAKSAPKRAP